MEFCSLPKNPEGDCPTISLFSSWVMQQDNDPKQLSKSPSEWIKKNEGFGVPYSKPRLKLEIGILWHDLKKAINPQKPFSVAEL